MPEVRRVSRPGEAGSMDCGLCGRDGRSVRFVPRPVVPGCPLPGPQRAEAVRPRNAFWAAGGAPASARLSASGSLRRISSASWRRC